MLQALLSSGLTLWPLQLSCWKPAVSLQKRLRACYSQVALTALFDLFQASASALQLFH